MHQPPVEDSRRLFGRSERLALVMIGISATYMTLPLAAAFLSPSLVTPIPVPITTAVLLLGFAACTRLLESAIAKRRWLAAGASILGGVGFAVLVYATLTYCPGGQ